MTLLPTTGKDSLKSSKLAKHFGLFLAGKQAIRSGSNAKIFLEAICDQQDKINCIERLIASPSGIQALKFALRLDVSISFINGTASNFVGYLNEADLDELCNGQFLHQIIQTIVDPPTFWNALLRAHTNGALNEYGEQSFAWLLLQILRLPGELDPGHLSTAHTITNNRCLLQAASLETRILGQKIKHTLSSLACAESRFPDGPGGRHDNDHPDFRQISVLPTADELSSDEAPFLRRASDVTKSSQDLIAVHLDNQFRLLRDDMLSELRSDLQIARGAKTGRRRSPAITGLSLVGVNCGDEKYRKPCGLIFHCNIPRLSSLTPKQRKTYLKENKNLLKHQSIGCLVSKDEIVGFATIERDEDLLAQGNPAIVLQFSADSGFMKVLQAVKANPSNSDLRLFQVDTPFFAYEPILRGLQNKKELPLSEELLLMEAVEQSENTKARLRGIVDSITENPSQNFQQPFQTPKPIYLDKSQADSVIAAFTRRVSLIQGPPGTGKSFIGALLAKAITASTSWKMLVVCYTNHALDQFLEDLMDIGIHQDTIVRLGSKSTPRTAPLLLRDQASRQAKTLSRDSWTIINRLKLEASELVAQLQSTLRDFLNQNVSRAELMSHLSLETDSRFTDAFTLPDSDDDMTLVDSKGKRVKKDYLLDRWMYGNNASVLQNTVRSHTHSIWAMDMPTRQRNIAKWRNEILLEKSTQVSEIAQKYNKCHAMLNDMFNERNAATIRQMRVIGCTTTGAAKYAGELQAASPDVVLVEEAGEVLESHVLTAMGPKTKQLILIGDHKQLRPKINNYEFTVEKGEGFDLNRSLFERLVLGGLPHMTLSEQHRMTPEISKFVRQLTYPSLVDSKGTQGRPKLRGFQHRVIFFNHGHMEEDDASVKDMRDQNSKTSKQNQFEVDMVLKCVRYLGQQGYGTDQIVILTPYLGQLRLLKDTLSKDHDPVLNDLDSYDLVRAGLMPAATASLAKRPIRLSTIDNYQGEESDIVVASLTRSNDSGAIGFMAAPERLNVLISRARDAMILIGNAETFLSSRTGHTTWKPFLDLLKESGYVYDGLPVVCERHPAKTALLREVSEFEKYCPDGGCAESCGTKLSCGVHMCPQKCHQLFDHSKMPCAYILESQCSKGHKLRWECNKGGPQPCRKCAAEAAIKEKRQRRDQALDAKREEKQRHYASKIFELDDLLEAKRQELKDLTEIKNMEHTIQQKQTDLDSISKVLTRAKSVEVSRTTSSAHNSGTTDEHRTAVKKTNKTPTPVIEITSKAREEWKQIKEFEKTDDAAMDDLMDMIGLEDVKQKVLGIKFKVDTALRQNTSLKHERFGAALLGNPGTGKTTVARLYAKILSSFGALPGDMFIETTGSRLANEGVNGCKKHIEKLLESGGGAIFVDEAYQLVAAHNQGGTQVLDFLLAEMENQTGKIVFILAGYNKQMEAFFQHNPGLISRIPHQLQFADYEDFELVQILCQLIEKKYESNMEVEGGLEGLYLRIAARRVGRGRGKEGFGNARAMQNAFQRITDRQSDRLRQERKSNSKVDDFLLTKEDLIGPEPSQAPGDKPAWKKLQGLVGLKSVKESVQSMLDLIQTNYQRELEERPLIECSLNRVFLGSPGTGKTSVAKLYGQILADIGLLSNGEVILKNPADFVGSVLGQSESSTKAILASTVGKVLIIDEAYMLYCGATTGGQNDSYKTAVIDTLVAEVQSVPGDDRCVLLLGYRDQMEQMFQNVNPGLARRFPIASAFEFEDFSNTEIAQIFDMKIKQQGFTTDPKAKKVALEVLERARNRPNFGNAGEVDILLDRAKATHQKRISAKKTKELDSLEAGDFDEDFERSAAGSTNCRKLFDGVVGCEDVVSKLEDYQETVLMMKELNQDPKEQIPFNFLFKGPPGTGKTTTARKMGKVFYDMGFLATASVIDCSATDLVGQYVGQTGPKVQQMLDKALGKVLFIDEAYRLGEGAFASEAIDELVDCLTKPRYLNKLVTILAGYDADIDKLISTNPGLSSRFPETIRFENLTPDHCVELLGQILQKKGVSLGAISDSPILKDAMFQLNKTPHWGNARDIHTLAKQVYGSILRARREQITPDPLLSPAVLGNIIINSIRAMTAERQTRASNSESARQVRLMPPPQMTQPLVSQNRPTVAPSAIAELENTVERIHLDPIETSPAPEAISRDAGVSDSIWHQLQLDIQAAEQDAQREQALIESMDRDRREAEETEQALRNKTAELSIAQGTDDDEENERRRRHEQARLEHLRALTRRREAHDEWERAKKAAEEERRKEAVAQQKLRKMGVCCMGYRWIKQMGGYGCAGGGHYVSNEQLGL